MSAAASVRPAEPVPARTGPPLWSPGVHWGGHAKRQHIPRERSGDSGFVLLVGSAWKPSSDKKVDEQNSHSNVEQNHHDNKDGAVDLHRREREDGNVNNQNSDSNSQLSASVRT